MGKRFRELFSNRRRRVEAAITLVLLGVIIVQYGSLAPRVIIVMAFLLSLALVLVQLPFLAGFYGMRRFRPPLVALLAALPFFISWGYELVYQKNLLVLAYEEWLGSELSAVTVLAVIALPLAAFLSGTVSRTYWRNRLITTGKEERAMPKLIEKATSIQAAGNKPKIIEEYIGRVNSGTTAVSIARMQSPSGWVEPGQTPEFDEYTVVLRGMLRVESKAGVIDVQSGQAVITRQGEWIRYSSPGSDGAEYVAVCLPAFSPETVRRDG